MNVILFQLTKVIAASFSGNKVFEGLKAVKYLLKDSKPIEGDMKFMSDVINEFKKSGGNAHAYRDFWAIKPMNIRRSGPSGSVSEPRYDKPFFPLRKHAYVILHSCKNDNF